MADLKNKKESIDELIESSKKNILKDVFLLEMYHYPLMLTFEVVKTGDPIMECFNRIKAKTNSELMELYEEMVKFINGEDIEVENQSDFKKTSIEASEYYEGFLKFNETIYSPRQKNSKKAPVGGPVSLFNEEKI